MIYVRDPRTAIGFEWDDENELRLALRGITPDMVERVFENEPDFYRGKKHGTARWMMEGRDPVTGQWLRLGILWSDRRAGMLRAIHGLNLAAK